MNSSEDTTFQKVWDAAKAVIRGKYIAIQSHLEKYKTTQRSNLISLLRELRRNNNKKKKNKQANKQKKHQN